MSTDSAPDGAAAETEAVLSLQEAPAAESGSEDVRAHISATSLTLCDVRTTAEAL
ncbi:hypothetical protein ACFV1L_20425 [Kitasatospora sp. NPDC059646]|uniref:hypothetical protein n=1 Tax=Kitasatospora sp. NPDC059646 TaxID=3346893 RepID=UPI0036B494BD